MTDVFVIEYSGSATFVSAFVQALTDEGLEVKRPVATIGCAMPKVFFGNSIR
jgi:hypothetical protein